MSLAGGSPSWRSSSDSYNVGEMFYWKTGSEIQSRNPRARGSNTIYSVKNKLPGFSSPAIAIAGLVSIRLVSGNERGNSKTEYVCRAIMSPDWVRQYLSRHVTALWYMYQHTICKQLTRSWSWSELNFWTEWSECWNYYSILNWNWIEWNK